MYMYVVACSYYQYIDYIMHCFSYIHDNSQLLTVSTKILKEKPVLSKKC